jgi:hypothetical protein
MFKTSPFSSGFRIGFIGGGQLARMSALQAFRFGMDVAVYASSPDEPLCSMTPHVTIGAPDDEAALTAFAASCDVVTLENEFLDSSLLLRVRDTSGTPMFPSPESFAKIEDKIIEKTSFAAAGMPQGSTVDPSTDAALLGPGMLREHYAPTTPLVLLDPAASPDAQLALISQGPEDRSAGNPSGNGLGRISFRELSPREAAPYRVVETLSHRGDLVEVARNLFAALRRLDAMGLVAIHCDTCQPLGLGRAIMDRLDRAAARWQ